MSQTAAERREYKTNWQREKRGRLARENGFSTTADYGCGKKRIAVLERDDYCCVACGMHDLEHKKKWGRPITIDHKDRDRRNNSLDNLQTLCLSCHGRKDITPGLVVPQVAAFKEDILARRRNGETYQTIAGALGFSVAAVWKWVKRWEK